MDAKTKLKIRGRCARIVTKLIKTKWLKEISEALELEPHEVLPYSIWSQKTLEEVKANITKEWVDVDIAEFGKFATDMWPWTAECPRPPLVTWLLNRGDSTPGMVLPIESLILVADINADYTVGCSSHCVYVYEMYSTVFAVLARNIEGQMPAYAETAMEDHVRLARQVFNKKTHKLELKWDL